MNRIIRNLREYSLVCILVLILIIGVLINHHRVWLVIGFIIADLFYPYIFNNNIKKFLKNTSYEVYPCLHRLDLLMLLPALILTSLVYLLPTFLGLVIYPFYGVFFALAFTLLTDVTIPYTAWTAVDSRGIILGSGKMFPRLRKIIGFDGIESISKLPWYSISCNFKLNMKSGEIINISVSDAGFIKIMRYLAKDRQDA